ncbi:hypothetical protein FSP39_022717 [Pinctada imbricata]|uniref:Uncharacterized protein n=1 Tax=Pinctada imbricata TaxID=66713 RepID=A0AA89BP63_PINIB|nr:hypothetical protein FSP39_022717 [Pinctada imbricata]
MEVLDEGPRHTEPRLETQTTTVEPIESSMKKKKMLFKRKRTLLIELKQSVNTKASTSSTQSGNEHGRKLHAGKTTFMLFLVTLGFIISYLPYSILVLAAIERHKKRIHDLEKKHSDSD